MGGCCEVEAESALRFFLLLVVAATCVLVVRGEALDEFVDLSSNIGFPSILRTNSGLGQMLVSFRLLVLKLTSRSL